MSELGDQIRKNIDTVQGRILRSAQLAGRDAAVVRLMVVTKTQPVEIVRAAIEAGALDLGENYPEEAQPKIEALRNEGALARWHMIGHLQSRKAKIVCADFDMLHSLDSLSLAQKLENHLAALGRTLPVLLEINTGGEVSKGGWHYRGDEDVEVLEKIVEQIVLLPHLEIRGLMTMPPYQEDGELSRPYFRMLAKLRSQLQTRFPKLGLNELSMGTSTDFEAAVQEGATFVRIGTAILGPRNYPAR